MNDARLFAQITLDFAENPKIEPLSDKAFRQFIEAILWSRRQLTDGFIPDRSIPGRFTPEVLNELTTNDEEKPSLIKVDGGYQIHDFCKHQTTKDQMKAKTVAQSENGKKGAAKRWGNSEPIANEWPADSQVIAKNSQSTENRVQSTELSSNTYTQNEFEQYFKKFWELYPRKIGKGQALKAFKVALKVETAEIILAGVSRMITDPNQPEKQYLPHPATWLNGQRWLDEPYPPRNRLTDKQQRNNAAEQAFLNSFNTPNQQAIEWDMP